MVDKYLALVFQMKDDDRHVARYVNDVVARLARASGDRRPWKAIMLDEDDANAFVTLGSTIYVNRGTLAILRSEAELAAVLGHEMGHLRGGHVRERWADMIRGNPRSAAEQMLDNRYARDDEIQADEHAVLLLEKAGYDTRAVVTMMSALAGTSRLDADVPEARHPWWPERIARVQALVSLRMRPGGELGEERYRARLATLIDGRDPRRQAIRVGNAAVMAKLKIAVDLPAGSPDPDDPDAKTTVILPDGARASVVAAPANMAVLFSLLDGDSNDKLVFRTEIIGSEVLLWIFEGKDAKRRMHELRRGKRAARPDELAQVKPPKYVSFDAPRQLWTRPLVVKE
jgi:predicted Zn-dependent protease